MNDELTGRALDGDDLQLPASFVVADPPRDDGPRDVVDVDVGCDGIDDVPSAGAPYPVLAAPPGEPDWLRFHTAIMSYTTGVMQYTIWV